MRALVTNDDGISAPGLQVLAQTAIKCGVEVVVAAPSWDSSGASASLTAVEEAGSFLRSPCEIPDVDATCFSVEAAPAFIVRAALEGALGPPPDLVLSGVNRGLNTGQTVLHSGTVGAALTAASRGIRAAAFSIAVEGAPIHWETAALVVELVVPWLCERDDLVALNVNIPNVGPDEVRGVSRAPLAASGAVQSAVSELGSKDLKLTSEQAGAPLPYGTDVNLVAANVVCVSPLRPVCDDDSSDTSGLARPSQSSVATSPGRGSQTGSAK